MAEGRYAVEMNKVWLFQFLTDIIPLCCFNDSACGQEALCLVQYRKALFR